MIASERVPQAPGWFVCNNDSDGGSDSSSSGDSGSGGVVCGTGRPSDAAGRWQVVEDAGG